MRREPEIVSQLIRVDVLEQLVELQWATVHHYDFEFEVGNQRDVGIEVVASSELRVIESPTNAVISNSSSQGAEGKQMRLPDRGVMRFKFVQSTTLALSSSPANAFKIVDQYNRYDI